MKKFITTTDRHTADLLIADGLKLIAHIGDAYTFVNQSLEVLTFSNMDKKKLIYTDKLSL